ncbi:MAG: hypothetical protein WC162_08795 [Sphaerochaetaceae bacterium]
MKKLLTILVVLFVTVISILAVELEENTIILSTIITELKDYEFTLTELSPSTNYNYDASAEGKANFKINSNSVVNFNLAPDLIDIAITVGPWTMIGETAGSNEVTLQSATLSPSESRASVNSFNNGFSVNFTSGYNSTFEIGTFSVGWSDQPTLAAGEYTSNVTISYTQI